MNYEWYESRATATVILQLQDKEELLETRTDEEYLVIVTSLQTFRIKIVHKYRIASHKLFKNRVEILLEKPENKKWMELDRVPVLAFERKTEVPTEEEVLSNDPVMNMLMEVYANAPASSKREMNKSFYESGGTELRTHKDTEKKKKK